MWFFARPEGQSQLFGSWLVVWDDLLPEYPASLAEPDAAAVANALVASYQGWRGPASWLMQSTQTSGRNDAQSVGGCFVG